MGVRPLLPTSNGWAVPWGHQGPTCGGKAPGQPVPLRLLLKHEVAAGLEGEILLRLGDVAQGAASPDQGPRAGALLCWPGHVQQRRQCLQEDLQQLWGYKKGHLTSVWCPLHTPLPEMLLLLAPTIPI